MKLRSALAALLLAAPLLGACSIDDVDAGDEEPGASPESLGSSAEALSVFQWSADAQIGTMGSEDAVTLASYAARVHMVYVGSSNQLFHASYDGSTWTKQAEIPDQRSWNRPALATFGNKVAGLKLHMVHQGASSDSLWWSVYDGTAWTPNVQLPIQSSQAPVAASYGGALHLFGTRTATSCYTPIGGGAPSCSSTEILWEATYDGATWSPRHDIVTSPNRLIDGAAGHAVAVYEGTPTLVVRRASNDLWHYTYANGAWSGGTKIAGQKSKSAPALSAWGGVLHMTHLGDSSNSIWWSTYDGAAWTTNVTIPNQYSAWSPSLAPLGQKLVQAHNGDTTTKLYFSTFQ